MDNSTNGKCIIFSAPSGAGKTTIVKYLLRNVQNLVFSISAASRKPRGREVNGIDYHFFSVQEFKDKIQNNDFVEWEEVYTDNFYGTLKAEVEKAWNNGKTVVFDEDLQETPPLSNPVSSGEQCFTRKEHDSSCKLLSTIIIVKARNFQGFVALTVC